MYIVGLRRIQKIEAHKMMFRMCALREEVFPLPDLDASKPGCLQLKGLGLGVLGLGLGGVSRR